jgi:hypothetical protein
MNYLDKNKKLEYLKIARVFASKWGYDTNNINFSNDGKHKLYIITPDNKIIRFGHIDYDDYILFFLKGDDTARQHRNLYLNRTKNMLGQWKNDAYSKNNLSRRILWNSDS